MNAKLRALPLAVSMSMIHALSPSTFTTSFFVYSSKLAHDGSSMVTFGLPCCMMIRFMGSSTGRQASKNASQSE